MPHLNLVLPALILAVALPATSAYTYYRATRDPTLRPLGVTKEEIAANAGEEHALDITVQVDWGRDTEFGVPPDELERALSRSLQAFDADHHFRFKDVPGDDVLVTYIVGYNRFGPYHPTQAAAGIRSALTALQMVTPDD